MPTPCFRKTFQSSWWNSGGFVGILHDSTIRLPITNSNAVFIAAERSCFGRTVSEMEIVRGLLRRTAEEYRAEGNGVNSMQYRAMAVLLSGAMGILVTGCASSTPMMRAQSPQGNFQSWSDGPIMNDGCPMCQSGMGHGQGQACPPGRPCPPQGGHCQGAGCNLPCHPVHRNFHTYEAPQNLMYPPENAAPAQVQYPYYTFRGPTDFFMK